MKVKINTLIGPALDWAVAKCEGHEWRCPWLLEKEGYVAWRNYERAWGYPTPPYSTDWSQGGPIIERERISVSAHQDGVNWQAWRSFYRPFYEANAPLIAAMRCYVASQLGDEVDVPEELL